MSNLRFLPTFNRQINSTHDKSTVLSTLRENSSKHRGFLINADDSFSFTSENVFDRFDDATVRGEITDIRGGCKVKIEFSQGVISKVIMILLLFFGSLALFVAILAKIKFQAMLGPGFSFIMFYIVLFFHYIASIENLYIQITKRLS